MFDQSLKQSKERDWGLNERMIDGFLDYFEVNIVWRVLINSGGNQRGFYTS